MVYAFSEYELDTRLMELRRAGEPWPVEPQVFDVLRLLVVHRDRVVTRRELLHQVWGHTFVTDATISSRVMAARRAIGDDGAAQAAIRTVRGRGYRFVAQVREERARRLRGGPTVLELLVREQVGRLEGESRAAIEELGRTAAAALARGDRGVAAGHLARALDVLRERLARAAAGPDPG